MSAPRAVTGPPRRARRVDEVPVPRIRPLAEVLGSRGPVPAGDRTAPEPPDPREVQDGLDRLAATLRPVAAGMLGAVVDVLAGRRPPAHLGALLTPAALTALAGAAPARPPGRGGAPPDGGRTRDPRPVLRGLRVCAVSERAVEVSAVLDRHQRARALAARLERTAESNRWRVVALSVG